MNSCKRLLLRNKLPVKFSQKSFQHFFVAESPLHKISGVIGLEFEKKIGLLRSLLIATAKEFFEKIGYTFFPKNQVPAFIRNISEFYSICPESSICMHKVMGGSNG